MGPVWNWTEYVLILTLNVTLLPDNENKVRRQHFGNCKQLEFPWLNTLLVFPLQGNIWQTTSHHCCKMEPFQPYDGFWLWGWWETFYGFFIRYKLPTEKRLKPNAWAGRGNWWHSSNNRMWCNTHCPPGFTRVLLYVLIHSNTVVALLEFMQVVTLFSSFCAPWRSLRSIVKYFVCNVFVMCRTPVRLAVTIGVGYWAS
jgi:hypothetical protein